VTIAGTFSPSAGGPPKQDRLLPLRQAVLASEFRTRHGRASGFALLTSVTLFSPLHPITAVFYRSSGPPFFLRRISCSVDVNLPRDTPYPVRGRRRFSNDLTRPFSRFFHLGVFPPRPPMPVFSSCGRGGTFGRTAFPSFATMVGTARAGCTPFRPLNLCST